MSKQPTLIEITGLAAENASRALSKLSGETVKVEVSKVEIAKVQKGFSVIHPESMVAGVYLPVTGEVKGGSLLIFPEKIACDLCDLLVRREPGTTHQLTELDKSALKEAGNIVCGSFLTVLSNTLNIRVIEHVPSFSFDMFGAVADQIITQFALKAGEALVIEVKFVFEKTHVGGYVVLMFGLEEMNAIVDALGGVKIGD
ncbi:MAG: CheY-P phosphatase CheC [Candidatus Scalindua rubra]|uniref:CheY-P phosphatase CheC n=1 Tax=Candidatus Scalindua rubra TaxID=1872076 RepID=A0A1E3XFY7_9BACT|nr:MAG: CheY-P phosphatase CheC [Candidatus Scalindua rubra]